MVLLNGRFSKFGFFLTQLCLDTPPWWSMKYWLWCSSIARKTMVEMLYGATWWDILQGWFLSFPMMSRYSTIMTNEIFPLMLLNWKKKNGGDALWCCSMGDSPRLVSFLLNCVKILHHNDQWNIAFDAPQLQEKQWWRYSMVLLNGRFSNLGFFLTQLCLDTPHNYQWNISLDALQLQENDCWIIKDGL